MKPKRNAGRTVTAHPIREFIRKLPDSPGVYLFYGQNGELLYVGKSKAIRTRVRSHFGSADERRMCRQICHIEARQTVGELGALLLESQLIKELRPFYNRMSRHRRRMIVARRRISPDAYIRVHLEAVARIDPAYTEDILGIFKTRSQARDFLTSAARTNRLCLNLLGLENSKRSCFSYHLHQCNGACIGLEPAEPYNTRVEEAFAERRIQAWPFPGAILIEEKSADTTEVFVVDNWCMLYSFTIQNDKPKLSVRGIHLFDYDSYRILAGYVLSDSNKDHIRPARRNEIGILLEKAQAA